MACWLFVTAKIHDREVLAKGYAPAAAKVAAEFGGKYIVRGPITGQLEGESLAGQSAIVIEFPDKETALSFYNSPGYAEAKKLREGIADISISVVEAPPSPKG